MSDTDFSARQQHGETINAQKIQEYLDAFGFTDQLTRQEAKQFVEIAIALQLNPFKRELHCVPYGQGDKRKLSIITGYEVYLKRAERIDLLDGWDIKVEGTLSRVQIEKQARNGGTYMVEAWRGDLKAVINIYRKDRAHPITWEVYHDEVTQDNEIWRKSPRFMTKKVCMAQGFRLAFPDEMGGMPYTADELPDEMTVMRNVTESEEKKEKNDDGQSDGDPLRKKMTELNNRLGEILKTAIDGRGLFTDEDRQRAKTKRGKLEVNEQDHDYLASVVKEYELELEKRMQFAALPVGKAEDFQPEEKSEETPAEHPTGYQFAVKMLEKVPQGEREKLRKELDEIKGEVEIKAFMARLRGYPETDEGLF